MHASLAIEFVYVKGLHVKLLNNYMLFFYLDFGYIALFLIIITSSQTVNASLNIAPSPSRLHNTPFCCIPTLPVDCAPLEELKVVPLIAASSEVMGILLL